MDDRLQRQTMTSPDAETKTDSVRDMAKEQRSNELSRRNERLTADFFLGCIFFGTVGGKAFGLA